MVGCGIGNNLVFLLWLCMMIEGEFGMCECSGIMLVLEWFVEEFMVSVWLVIFVCYFDEYEMQ